MAKRYDPVDMVFEIIKIIVLIIIFGIIIGALLPLIPK